jgi:NAD(P)H-dependent FMN reductase
MNKLKIKVIIGSTREGRFGDKPAKWIYEEAKKLEGTEVELLDLRDYPMPFYESAITPSMISDGNYGHDIVNAWAKKIAEADAFVIVSPEYNRGPSAVLKNAIDHVYAEWNKKVVGFVSYGSTGGARAVEQLRLNSVELQMAPVRAAVHIPGNIVFPIIMGKAEWNAETEAGLKGQADTMLQQVVWWGNAVKAARENAHS